MTPCGGTSCPGFGQCPQSSPNYGTVTQSRRSRTPEFGRIRNAIVGELHFEVSNTWLHRDPVTACRVSHRPILRPNDVSPW